MTESRTALIVGAGGTFGAHASLALIKQGWRIRALARDPAAASARLGPRTPVEWRAGDAMNAASVARAAEGAQLVVHAVNPPGYRDWPGTVPAMFESSLAAATASGARLVLPASVYNFAPDAGPDIAEEAPQVPATRKGAIRAALERRLRQACDAGARALVLRAGDFFGPAAPSSALAWLVRRRGTRLTGMWAPGPDAVGHAWAYMPDLGKALARLVEREAELEPFAVFHFRGHWLERSGDMARSVARVAGRPDLPVRPFPWIAVDLAAPFNETMRELREMRYLWRAPIGLDNAKLARQLGEEPHTPLDDAIRATLADMEVLADAGPDLERSYAPPSAMAAR